MKLKKILNILHEDDNIIICTCGKALYSGSKFLIPHYLFKKHHNSKIIDIDECLDDTKGKQVFYLIINIDGEE